MKIRAFTLIELLVAIAIVATLTALAIPITRSAGEAGRRTKEIAGARHLIAAYSLYTADHNGDLMAGWKSEPARHADGTAITYPSNARYPWRLAPYLGHQLKGAALVNGRESLATDPIGNAYAISVTPSMGINAVFVGGHYGGASDVVPTARAFETHGDFVVQRAVQAVSPAQLIVFASARSTETGEEVEGYDIVKSPRLQSARWSAEFDAAETASAFGYVHPRYAGKAVVACLAGNVEMLGEAELKDMRRWSNQAAQAGDPDWTLTRQ